MSHIQLNYAFLLFWSILGDIHNEFLFLDQKVIISEKCTEILGNIFFLSSLKWGKSRGKFWFFKHIFLDQTSKMGEILTKKKILPKVSHIQQNYVFLLFWSILGEIHRELLFLVHKVSISERSTGILRKLVFLYMFDMGQILMKI